MNYFPKAIKNRYCLDSRKLPKETELQSYLECFKQEFDNIETKMLSIDKSIQQEITKKEVNILNDNGYYHWNTGYNKCEPGKYPCNVNDIWISRSFGYELENVPKPKMIIASNENDAIIHNENSGLTNDLFKAGVSEKIISELIGKSRKMVRISTNKISQANQIRIKNDLDNHLDSYRRLQLDIFHKKLREQGFVSRRGEPEIRTEIAKRQIQYPGTKIYVLLGNDIGDYMGKIYKSYMCDGAFLINTKNDFQDYESAIISEIQIRAAHKIYYWFAKRKEPRWWYIYVATAMEFSIEIDKRETTENIIKKNIPVTLARFDCS